MLNNTVIQVQELSKRFGTITALNQVSLSIKQGEIVALLGANGAGKTTLINHLLGRLIADSGSVSILGQKPGSLAARQAIGAILQSNQMPGTLTVEEHIELFSSYYPNPRTIDSTLAIARLDDLAKRKFDQLSGGQKQRLFFALAICGQPEIVILDEPTVGLDVEARRDFWQCIRELAAKGTTILLTTHYLEEADALADRILLLADGKIVQEGSAESIKARLGGKRIRFKCGNQEQDLSKLPGVTEFKQRGSYMELMSQSAEHTLQYLFQSGVDLSDLTVEQVSLEDAYLHLSQPQAPMTQEKVA